MRSKLYSSILGMVLVGCSAFDTRPPEEVVEARALQRVQALMTGDYDKAYALTTPAYRTLESETDYTRRWIGASMWREVGVARVKCAAPDIEVTKCRVAVRITFDPPRAPVTTTHMQEDWLKVDGKWYFYQPRGSAVSR